MTSIQQHLKLALSQQHDTVNEFQGSIFHNSLDEDEIGYTHNLDDSLCIIQWRELAPIPPPFYQESSCNKNSLILRGSL